MAKNDNGKAEAVAADVNASTAPEQSTPEQSTAPAADTGTNGGGSEPAPLPANPIPEKVRHLFSGISFHTVNGNQKTYRNDDGSMQQKIGAGVLDFAGGFLGTPFNVNAYKASAKAKPTIKIAFAGNRGTQGVMATDEIGKGYLSELKAWAAEEYRRWRRGQGIAVTTPTSVRQVELDEEYTGGLFQDE
jgi:hypothetical protein